MKTNIGSIKLYDRRPIALYNTFEEIEEVIDDDCGLDIDHDDYDDDEDIEIIDLKEKVEA